MIVANTIATLTPGRETALARTKAQEAMMWTGNLLKYTGIGDNPYAANDGNRKTVADIAPMFDFTDGVLKFDTEIETIDQLRQSIDRKINELSTFDPSEDDRIKEDANEMLCAMSMFGMIQNMSECRMWLGMTLGAIRDAQ